MICFCYICSPLNSSLVTLQVATQQPSFAWVQEINEERQAEANFIGATFLCIGIDMCP
jgi:hypothetical protein